MRIHRRQPMKRAASRRDVDIDPGTPRANAGRPAGEARIVVGPNVHVSHERADIAHREVILAADPNRPNRLLAASMIEYKGNPLPPSVAYASDDGGTTWRLVLERRSPEDREHLGGSRGRLRAGWDRLFHDTGATGPVPVPRRRSDLGPAFGVGPGGEPGPGVPHGRRHAGEVPRAALLE